MFSPVIPIAGNQPFNDWFVPDTNQRHMLGLRIIAVDPYWGLGTFMYIKSNDAILKGSLVMWDETMQGALLPTTAGQGFSFGVAMAPIPLGSYGWIQLEGLAVYKTNSAVAADTAVAVAAAGIVGTLANGKQLNGVRNRRSATATTNITFQTTNNQGTLFCPKGYDGAFLGMAIPSGSGIPASAFVAALDADGHRIYMGSAIGTLDKVATATGLVTAACVYTGYGAGVINNPFAQGQIV